MTKALKECVVPVLRERGFKGTFPHFRRLSANAVHLLSFCFSQSGGSFCVEVTGCRLDAFVDGSGQPLAFQKANVWNVPYRRIRLGWPDWNLDHWFRFDESAPPHIRTTTFRRADGDPCRAAALAVLPWLDKQAEPYWRQITAE